jgi:hypothetical protein
MLVSLGGALAAARVMAKRWHSPHGPFWTGIAASIGTVAIFAVVGNAVIQPDRRADAVNRSRGTLMMTYDPPRLAAYDYPSGHWIAEDELWRLGRLVYPLDRFTSSRATLLPRPVALPAGRYQAAFWFNHRPPEATVTVLYSGRPPARLGDASGDRTNPAVVEFELPVTARGVEFAIQPAALADRLTRVELTPTGVVPRSRRPGASMPRSMFPIPGWAGGFVCFLDENSYPDAGMSWIRGGRSASILVVPAGATLVRVKLQAGAAPGPVSVVSSGQQTRVTLERNAHGDVYVPVPPGTHSLAIDVSSTSGFRPSDVNPQSGDRRYLGVRVGIELLR